MAHKILWANVESRWPETAEEAGAGAELILSWETASCPQGPPLYSMAIGWVNGGDWAAAAPEAHRLEQFGSAAAALRIVLHDGPDQRRVEPVVAVQVRLLLPLPTDPQRRTARQ